MRNKRGFSKLMGGLVGLAFLGMAGSANASLIGDTVGCNVTGGGSFSCNQPTAVVGAGPEFTVGGGNAIFVNIGDSSVFLFYNTSLTLGFTVINLTGLDWVGMNGRIVGADLAGTQVSGLSQGDLSTTANSLSIDLRNTQGGRGARTLIKLETVHVNEPATLAVFGASLVGLGLMLRRRRRTA